MVTCQYNLHGCKETPNRSCINRPLCLIEEVVKFSASLGMGWRFLLRDPPHTQNYNSFINWGRIEMIMYLLITCKALMCDKIDVIDRKGKLFLM